MPEYVLSCCSTADLTAQHFASRGIEVMSFHYQMNGVERQDDLFQTISAESFYRQMVDGADTKTSQPNVEEYVAHFEPLLKAGKDVLHLTLSSGISGAINSATLAQQQLAERYPDRKLYVLDSLAASSGYGLLMDALADKRDEGLTIDEVHQWAHDHRLDVHHWFFSTDLTFFIKGGRVSKTSGLIGTALHICPLLNVDYQGRLIPREKIRSKKKTIKRIVQVMHEHVQDGTDYQGKCYISMSACPDDARAVADAIEAEFPHLNGHVLINNIGPTIGCHTGPGTVALFFWGDRRND